MKIGVVSEFYYPLPGGISEHIRALSEELTALGHEVVVLTSRIDGSVPAPGPRVERLGRGLPVPYNGSLSRLTVGWRLRGRLRRVLEEENFDLLHVHNPLMPGLPRLALREARCPVVATFHSCYRRDLLVSLFRRPLRRLLERVDVRVPVSRAARRTVEPLFPGEYRVIPNGVDYEWFARAAYQRERLRPPDGRLRILFIGALVRRKGLPVLLRAFSALREQRDDVMLHVVGDGPERWRVRRMVPSHLRSEVRWSGCLSRTDLLQAMAEADIFCAPSLGRESFGIVLLEAMAARLPVLASNIDGYRDVVRDEVNGLLVRPGDPEAWAGALRGLLDDPVARDRIGGHGQLRAYEFHWRGVARRLAAVYGEAVSAFREEPLRVITPDGAEVGTGRGASEVPVLEVSTGARRASVIGIED